MKLVKPFRIISVKGFSYSDPWVCVELSQEDRNTAAKSEAYLDRATFVRFEVPMSLDILGGCLTITIESFSITNWLPTVVYIGEDEREIRIYEDIILNPDVLERRELTVVVSSGIRNRKESMVFNTLNLRTLGFEERKLAPQAFPAFNLDIGLSEEEYAMCLELSADSHFVLTLEYEPRN